MFFDQELADMVLMYGEYQTTTSVEKAVQDSLVWGCLKQNVYRTPIIDAAQCVFIAANEIRQMPGVFARMRTNFDHHLEAYGNNFEQFLLSISSIGK